MQVSIAGFEKYIEDDILERGFSYFTNGLVHEPELIEHDIYEFVVEGTDNYIIHIVLQDDLVMEHLCNCPYEFGPVCKHIVAALYYLQENEFNFSPKRKALKRKKGSNTANQINEMLENAPHEALKEFIREKAMHDRMFRNVFLTSFAHLNVNESKSLYVKQIQAILKSASDRSGYIDWSSTSQLSTNIHEFLDIAQKHANDNNVQSAMLIITAVMEEMIKSFEYADDSHGDIGGTIDRAFELFHELATKNQNEEIRKEMLAYCRKSINEKLFEDWTWYVDILRISTLLVKNEDEAEKIFSLLENMQKWEYNREASQEIKYELLLKIKGEKEAIKYLEENIGNSNFRRKAIQHAITRKDYETAKSLAQDGINYDKEEKPGLVSEWYNWLLKIAQVQGQTEDIITYARYLFIENFRDEQDYYQVLKKHVPPESWNTFITNIVEELSTEKRWININLLAGIYIREKWWGELLKMVQRNPDLTTIEYYEEYLKDDYAHELIDMYASEVLRIIERNKSRKHYQYACECLRSMMQLGGIEKADEIISQLQYLYPRRPALMEELNKLKC